MRTLVATGITDGVGHAVMQGLFQEEPFAAVLVGRSREKLDRLVDELTKISPASRFEVEVADLSLVAEVKALAQRILARHESIDVLFQSAGTVPARLELTGEGIERSLAVSFVCRAQLYHGLKPLLLAAESPLVFHVASPGQNGKVHLDDLNMTNGFRPTRAVPQFQQLNDALAVEESATTKIKVIAYSPGIVDTSIHKGWTPAMRFLITRVLGPFLMRSPEEAAKVPIATLRSVPKGIGPLLGPKGQTLPPSRELLDPNYRRRVLTAASKLAVAPR